LVCGGCEAKIKLSPRNINLHTKSCLSPNKGEGAGEKEKEKEKKKGKKGKEKEGQGEGFGLFSCSKSMDSEFVQNPSKT